MLCNDSTDSSRLSVCLASPLKAAVQLQIIRHLGCPVLAALARKPCSSIFQPMIYALLRSRSPLMQTCAHLAACMTVLSCTLLNAPIRMEFKSPRRTHPYQIDVCNRRSPVLLIRNTFRNIDLAMAAAAPCQKGQHPQQEQH